MPQVTSCLWFEKDAREAVDFYVETIPQARSGRSTPMPADSPSGPAGSVSVIEFSLADQDFVALQAGPLDPFNHSFSIQVACDTQDEIDRIWNTFLAHDGVAEQCGWLRDRWGLSWQIVPRALADMMADPDRQKARRAAEAMLTMVKLDIAALQKAFDG